MIRRVCKGKIHRATVTQADLNYMGSVTIDQALMEAANILPFEMVQITNLSNGALWHTYAIEGARGSGTLCLNGPPARLFQPGDQVIILSLGYVTDSEWSNLTANVVFVDEQNQVQSIVPHRPGAEQAAEEAE
ncbi:aspartate 1-decarboxylase [Alicyclobacillus cycloheptanicus]|uniref:Aspartate 1-decarboxylase n=1 Tax=Alicyclobacillus cycloheptanicus TaxID=1457 RepID=A0ABT9XED0_9BACL|nr:aspartate 1-decarboxylase [Alicyclobacillus cycloheptanicus]MDQ0188640.1 aspartate 1-decarboxylase [Alicyclobacillus cycloheptanicus]WDM00684.1 aspartate 1-decarboxylase [Alicyclobacillus cycloheptanicus]